MADDGVLSAELDLDVSNALSSVGEVGSALDDALQPSGTGGSNALDSTASSMKEVGSSAESAASGSQNLEGSLKGVEGVALLATGKVGGMRTAVQGFGASAIPAVAGSLALAGGIKELADKGIEATSVAQRFNTIVGSMKGAVENVHVGNLNTNLDSLALKLGTVPSKLQNSNASLFQFAKNAGATGKEAASFANNITALAARSVALNPSLGDVSTVADQMSVRLARGGIFAARLGVSLSQTEVAARAMADTGKTTASDLTVYEKSAAAASLATEKYGNSLSQTVTKGSENAAITQRRFQAEIEHTLETVGKPLVAPLFAIIEQSLPAVTALAQVLGVLGGAALPAVADAAAAVAVPLKIVADVLKFLTPVLGPAIDAWLAYVAVTRLVGPGADLVVKGIQALVSLIGNLIGQVTGATAAQESLAAAEASQEQEAQILAGQWIALGDAANTLTLTSSQAAEGMTALGDEEATLAEETSSLTASLAALGPELASAVAGTDALAGADEGLAVAETGAGTAGEAAGLGIGAALGPVGALAAGAFALGNALGLMTQDSYNAADAVQALSKATSDQIESQFQADAVVQAFSQHTSVADAQLKLFRQTAESNYGTAQRLAEVMSRNGENTDKYRQILVETSNGLKQQASDSKASEAATRDNTAAVDQATAAYENHINSIFGAISADLAYREAISKIPADVTAFNQALQQNGIFSAQAGAAMRQFESDALAAAKAAGEKAAADNGGAQSARGQAASTQAQIAYLEQLASTLDPGSPLRKRLEDYISQLLGVPPTVATNAVLNTADAEAKAAHLLSVLGSVQHIASAAAISFATAPGNFFPTASPSGGKPGMMAGGDVLAGESYIVGEHRPEVFTPNVSGRISAGAALAGSAAGAAAAPVQVMLQFVVNGHVYGDSHLVDLVTGIFAAHNDDIARAVRVGSRF